VSNVDCTLLRCGPLIFNGQQCLGALQVRKVTSLLGIAWEFYLVPIKNESKALHHESVGEVSCPIGQLRLSRDRSLTSTETPRLRLTRPPSISAPIDFTIWGV
jgi:hypothetical protein